MLFSFLFLTGCSEINFKNHCLDGQSFGNGQIIFDSGNMISNFGQDQDRVFEYECGNLGIYIKDSNIQQFIKVKFDGYINYIQIYGIKYTNDKKEDADKLPF